MAEDTDQSLVAQVEAYIRGLVKTEVNNQKEQMQTDGGMDESTVRELASEVAMNVVSEHETTYTHVASGAMSSHGLTTVGRSGEFRTLQAAWDDAPFGESLSIWLLPDYDPTAESYPIEFHSDSENRWKPISLRGPGPGAVSVGHDGISGDALSIIGPGHHDYSRPLFIDGVRFAGGGSDGAGLSIADVPHAMLSNLVFNTSNHGLEVCKGDTGCFGLTATKLQAWNCGGDGIRLNSDAKPHNTQLYGCKAIANKGRGIVWFGGTQGAIIGCDIELNHDYGIELRGQAVTVSDCYIEGNARGVDYPVEIYGRGANGLTVRDCYFHGINPRSASHDHKRVQRAVNLHESTSVSMKDCAWKRYGDRVFAGFKGTEAKLYPDTHLAMDKTPLTRS